MICQGLGLWKVFFNMLTIDVNEYNLQIFKDQPVPNKLAILDHLGGFDSNFNNAILTNINAIASPGTRVEISYLINSFIAEKYPNLKITFSIKQEEKLIPLLYNYTSPPDINYKNFICSFNGSTHVGRRFLTAALHKFNWFNPEYCSKNFTYSIDQLDDHIKEYTGKRERIYRKFFIDDSEFCNQIYSFGHSRHDHANNIYNLEPKLTGSFLHLVSETLSTSYYPFITEKAFYSIVTKGLFLSYAQPRWHKFLQHYYGFKLYSNIFDYRFDSIENPVERLVELLSMISKFSHLTAHEWHDLYLIEKDTIEYNYDWYFSGNYLTWLEQFT